MSRQNLNFYEFKKGSLELEHHNFAKLIYRYFGLNLLNIKEYAFEQTIFLACPAPHITKHEKCCDPLALLNWKNHKQVRHFLHASLTDILLGQMDPSWDERLQVEDRIHIGICHFGLIDSNFVGDRLKALQSQFPISKHRENYLEFFDNLSPSNIKKVLVNFQGDSKDEFFQQLLSGIEMFYPYEYKYNLIT